MNISTIKARSLRIKPIMNIISNIHEDINAANKIHAVNITVCIKIIIK